MNMHVYEYNLSDYPNWISGEGGQGDSSPFICPPAALSPYSLGADIPKQGQGKEMTFVK